MTEEEVRKLREALYVLQEQLLRNLLYDALKTEEADPLNFFRVYRGALMDGVVVDWWKIFGSNRDGSHWTHLIPEDNHNDCREELRRRLAALEPAEDYAAIWDQVRQFRNTAVAHLDFDEAARAQNYPRLTPLKATAEIIYRRIYDMLNEVGRAGGFPSPEGMTGELREAELAHYREMADASREALSGFQNSAFAGPAGNKDY